ncbi:hypothetical protein NQ315_013878 [Exocentrus adspersus]|uniref:YqaJ viral recombinase domain-containing protein n=1 Tax=Exocentrus adspersus TaxID=1586481 RepID=A0AAV8V851_9CUCU|nr:hypothetical protein NQ315_013878 [Exocentrus adspersus]
MHNQNDKFLEATPDGLVAEGLVEVKCPYSARDLTPDEAIFRRKVTFWKQNGEINETHKWFYQIQGQMMVTRRKYCCFAIWTPKGIKQEVIFKDEEFCIRMRNKLCEFYLKCCLPELIDPRKSRNMEIINISVKKKEE